MCAATTCSSRPPGSPAVRYLRGVRIGDAAIETESIVMRFRFGHHADGMRPARHPSGKVKRLRRKESVDDAMQAERDRTLIVADHEKRHARRGRIDGHDHEALRLDRDRGFRRGTVGRTEPPVHDVELDFVGEMEILYDNDPPGRGRRDRVARCSSRRHCVRGSRSTRHGPSQATRARRCRRGPGQELRARFADVAGCGARFGGGSRGDHDGRSDPDRRILCHVEAPRAGAFAALSQEAIMPIVETKVLNGHPDDADGALLR